MIRGRTADERVSSIMDEEGTNGSNGPSLCLPHGTSFRTMRYLLLLRLSSFSPHFLFQKVDISFSLMRCFVKHCPFGQTQGLRSSFGPGNSVSVNWIPVIWPAHLGVISLAQGIRKQGFKDNSILTTDSLPPVCTSFHKESHAVLESKWCYFASLLFRWITR